jgi:antirestriction protein
MSTETEHEAESPRIYIACLAAYNNGILHGRWIDVDEDASAEVIREEIAEMLSESPIPGAEEWAIHDYEGFGCSLSEWEDIEKVAELGRMIGKHGRAYIAYAEHVGRDYATEQGFEESYRGAWNSEEAYAEDLFDELYAHEIPENLRCYIDYEAFARDLFMGDCYSIDNPDGGVYVFDNC